MDATWMEAERCIKKDSCILKENLKFWICRAGICPAYPFLLYRTRFPLKQEDFIEMVIYAI